MNIFLPHKQYNQRPVNLETMCYGAQRIDTRTPDFHRRFQIGAV